MPVTASAPAIERTVRRGGSVRYQGATYHHVDLAAVEGVTVTLATPAVSGDPVDVFTVDGAWICQAHPIDPPDDPPTDQPAVTPNGPKRPTGSIGVAGDGPTLERPERAIRHYQDLSDASIIRTEALLLAEHAILDLVDDFGIGLLYGEAGLGKTTALEWSLRKLRHTTVSFPSRPTRRETVATLYELIVGTTPRGNRYAIERALRDALRTPNVIAVDEAQNLPLECLHQLRQLHDLPDTRFALIFVGGPGCGANLDSDPMLASRIHRRVEFRELDEATLLEAIPNYHPLYRDVEPAMILRINDEYARGSFRAWARFTHTAARLCARADQPLSDDIVDAVKAIS